MDSSLTCADCRFWEPEEGMPSGECRRRAPVAVAVEPEGWTGWPRTAGVDWCGEGERPLPAPILRKR